MTAGSGVGAGGEVLPLISSRKFCHKRIASSREAAWIVPSRRSFPPIFGTYNEK